MTAGYPAKSSDVANYEEFKHELLVFEGKFWRSGDAKFRVERLEQILNASPEETSSEEEVVNIKEGWHHFGKDREKFVHKDVISYESPQDSVFEVSSSLVSVSSKKLAHAKVHFQRSLSSKFETK